MSVETISSIIGLAFLAVAMLSAGIVVSKRQAGRTMLQRAESAHFLGGIYGWHVSPHCEATPPTGAATSPWTAPPTRST